MKIMNLIHGSPLLGKLNGSKLPLGLSGPGH
jgi:hypothetical protein